MTQHCIILYYISESNIITTLNTLMKTLVLQSQKLLFSSTSLNSDTFHQNQNTRSPIPPT